MIYPGYPALAGGSHFSVTEGLCESTAAVSFLTGSGVKAEKKYTKKFVLYSHEIITNFTTTVYKMCYTLLVAQALPSLKLKKLGLSSNLGLG